MHLWSAVGGLLSNQRIHDIVLHHTHMDTFFGFIGLVSGHFHVVYQGLVHDLVS